MADTKISALTAVVTPATTDEFPVNQGGTSKKETIAQIGTALFVRKRASGTSTSGTAGTVVAQITAAANTKLIDWSAVAAQTSTTNTTVRMTITYSDSTTTSDTSTASTSTTMIGNHGGILRLSAGAYLAHTAVSDKDVTDITITTQGTSSSGTRAGILSAFQVPI